MKASLSAPTGAEKQLQYEIGHEPVVARTVKLVLLLYVLALGFLWAKAPPTRLEVPNHEIDYSGSPMLGSRLAKR